MVKVKIHKGWYWSAGQRYGWKKDGYDSRGVGIARDVLRQNKEIIVEIEGKGYMLNCDKAREFINKYKSGETMQRGTVIGIISASLFDEQPTLF